MSGSVTAGVNAPTMPPVTAQPGAASPPAVPASPSAAPTTAPANAGLINDTSLEMGNLNKMKEIANTPTALI